MAKPILYDNHGRTINYLRLAVTDRCNLRCFYCMPEEGIDYVKRSDLLTYEEMVRLVKVVAEMGITKLRITGGEPFLRKDIMDFIAMIHAIPSITELHITTNGTRIAELVPELKRLGVKSINLSLDSLDRQRFFDITRRDEFDEVLKTMEQLLRYDIITKINTVVMAGKNEADILSMVELTKTHPINVRFIEEMPFNGETNHYAPLTWNYKRILQYIQTQYSGLQKLPDPPFSTSYNYKVPNYRGSIGIIAAYSRTFCGTCNRIRMTPSGVLKTCLYDNGVFNIKDLMRAGATDEDIKGAFLEALGNRAKDGFEAEVLANQLFLQTGRESMATIGG